MNIEKQIELEVDMADAGAAAYLRNQRKAEENGRGADLDYSRRLTSEFIQPLVQALDDWLNRKGPGKFGRARGLIRQVESEKCMFIALKCMFNDFTKESTPVSTANKIGKMIEDELRFSLFQQTHGAYYEKIIEDFKRKGTKDYRYMQRVLTFKANEHQDSWQSWSVEEKVDVGTKLLDIILTNTDLAVRTERMHKKKKIVEIKATPEALKFINDHEETKKLMYPERNPCIIPPDDWTALDQGGYYTPQLRSNVPMVKTKLPKAMKLKHDWSTVMDSLNKAQQTGWKVNARVREIAAEVWARNLQIGKMPGNTKLEPDPSPFVDRKYEELTAEEKEALTEWKHEASAIYTLEKERVSKGFQVTRILRMAKEYEQYDAFWYVWYCDFRGRMYTATAGFSPQGTDLAKGMLLFSEGVANGPSGAYWLKVHGANRYGYDKVDYDDRVAWVEERHDDLMRACNDPLGNRDVWSGADKPWQYLAWIFEYGRMYQEIALGLCTEETFVSYLPIGLDGTCNGLQNFSAMLRDPIGGAATNLISNPGKPSDIYGLVADVTARKIVEKLDKARSYHPETDEAKAERDRDLFFAQKWIEYGLTRKDAKRPVMTLPYGSTRQSATSYIFAEIIKKDKLHFGKSKAFSAAVWLVPLMWAAIGEVVVAAAQAMKWLQSCAGAMNKINEPIYWKTADGFLAVQDLRKIESKCIDTQLAGRFQVRVGSFTDELDKTGQRNGISPNFVHSQDATHLRMTVRAAWEEGITSMALIHDDYGTHAGNTDKLHRIIREQFVRLYRDNDPIEKFSDFCMMQGADVPPIPERGSLDLAEVLTSRYFFG